MASCRSPSGGAACCPGRVHCCYARAAHHVLQLLVVDLSDSQAVETGLGVSGLHEAFPRALQRFAGATLKDGEPVLPQVARWNSPVVLQSEHFGGLGAQDR
jgi:hypothetical protein